MAELMYDVIAAGHLCLDIIPQFPIDAGAELSAYLAPGRLAEVGPMTLSGGGAVSNTGLNLARLGVNTRLMGKVGDDLLGQTILQSLRSHDPALAEGMIVENETEKVREIRDQIGERVHRLMAALGVSPVV